MRILRPNLRARLTRFVSSSFRYEIFIYVYETEIPEMTQALLARK